MPAANVAAAKKGPPLETKEAIWTRNWVVFSFWAVVLFLGFPTWLWTTSIHRANLPIAEMLEWADGRACKPTFPIQIVFDTHTLAEHDSQTIIRMVQHSLDDNNEFPTHHLRLSSKSEYRNPELPALTVSMSPGSDTVVQLRPQGSTLDVFYNPSQVPTSGSTTSPLASTIASALQELFVEEQANIAYLLNTNTDPSSPLRDQAKGLSRILTPELASKLEKRQTRSMQYSPTYHITISLFTPSALPTSWDIEPAVQAYLSPLLSSFSISNFTVDTQIQLFSSFAPSFPTPEYDEKQKIWTLGHESLSGFINAAEWPLSPSIGSGLTLNFILYVPDPNNSPLVIKDTRANSWIVPQWGGVYILNPQSALGTVPQIPEALSIDDIKPALLTFSRQLMALLGAPENTGGSLDLQIRSLTRYRAASLLLSASNTLGSMARLTSKLSQIPIPENVAYAVDKTLEDLKESCELLKNGEFSGALEKARSADILAEEAFFDKSMVGQVYFPDEHKVAVYLPLLAPVSVPLVTSGIRVLKSFKSNRP